MAITRENPNSGRDRTDGSTFVFRQRHAPLDLPALSGVNPDEVRRNTDVETIQTHLTNLVFSEAARTWGSADSDISDFAAEHDGEQWFLKLFRASQLTVEYLLHVQQQLQNRASELEHMCDVVDRKADKAAAVLQARNNAAKELTRRVKNKRKTIATYELLLTQPPAGAATTVINKRQREREREQQQQQELDRPMSVTVCDNDGNNWTIDNMKGNSTVNKLKVQLVGALNNNNKNSSGSDSDSDVVVWSVGDVDLFHRGKRMGSRNTLAHYRITTDSTVILTSTKLKQQHQQRKQQQQQQHEHELKQQQLEEVIRQQQQQLQDMQQRQQLLLQQQEQSIQQYATQPATDATITGQLQDVVAQLADLQREFMASRHQEEENTPQQQVQQLREEMEQRMVATQDDIMREVRTTTADGMKDIQHALSDLAAVAVVGSNAGEILEDDEELLQDRDTVVMQLGEAANRMQQLEGELTATRQQQQQQQQQLDSECSARAQAEVDVQRLKKELEQQKQEEEQNQELYQQQQLEQQQREEAQRQQQEQERHQQQQQQQAAEASAKQQTEAEADAQSSSSSSTTTTTARTATTTVTATASVDGSDVDDASSRFNAVREHMSASSIQSIWRGFSARATPAVNHFLSGLEHHGWKLSTTVDGQHVSVFVSEDMSLQRIRQLLASELSVPYGAVHIIIRDPSIGPGGKREVRTKRELFLARHDVQVYVLLEHEEAQRKITESITSIHNRHMQQQQQQPRALARAACKVSERVNEEVKRMNNNITKSTYAPMSVAVHTSRLPMLGYLDPPDTAMDPSSSSPLGAPHASGDISEQVKRVNKDMHDVSCGDVDLSSSDGMTSKQLEAAMHKLRSSRDNKLVSSRIPHLSKSMDGLVMQHYKQVDANNNKKSNSSATASTTADPTTTAAALPKTATTGAVPITTTASVTVTAVPLTTATDVPTTTMTITTTTTTAITAPTSPATTKTGSASMVSTTTEMISTMTAAAPSATTMTATASSTATSAATTLTMTETSSARASPVADGDVIEAFTVSSDNSDRSDDGVSEFDERNTNRSTAAVVSEASMTATATTAAASAADTTTSSTTTAAASAADTTTSSTTTATTTTATTVTATTSGSRRSVLLRAVSHFTRSKSNRGAAGTTTTTTTTTPVAAFGVSAGDDASAENDGNSTTSSRGSGKRRGAFLRSLSLGIKKDKKQAKQSQKKWMKRLETVSTQTTKTATTTATTTTKWK